MSSKSNPHMNGKSSGKFNAVLLYSILACTPLLYACSSEGGKAQNDTSIAVAENSSSFIPVESVIPEINNQAIESEALVENSASLVSDDSEILETTNQNLETEEPVDVPSPEPALPTVTELRGVIYTETEAEIFWSAPLPSSTNNADAIELYEIWRNKELVKSTDGRSHYDNDLTPSTEYQYEVVSINSAGQRSDAVAINLTTRALSSTVNLENADQILGFVADIANEKYFAAHLENVQAVRSFSNRNIEASEALGFEYLSTTQRNEISFNHAFNCPNTTGSLVTWRTTSVQDYNGAAEFSACSLNINTPVVISGDSGYGWTLVRSVFNPGFSESRDFNNYVSVDEDGQSQTLNIAYYKSGSELATRTVNNRYDRFDGQVFNGRVFVSTAFEGTTFIESLNIARQSGKISNPDSTDAWKRELTTSFSAQSPRTGNKRITIETIAPLSAQADDSCFTVGIIRISGEDGSWMELNADTGDVNTFKLDVHTEGVTTSSQKSWGADTIFLQLLEDATVVEPPSIVSSNCAGYYIEHGL